MDHGYWHNKWEKNDIAFHIDGANPILVNHLRNLELEDGARVFVPLCGKTMDIDWLLSQGFSVVGVELSELAVIELFNRVEREPEVTEHPWGKLFHSDGVDIIVADVFDITSVLVGKVDAVYDRAALVALPEDIRVKYTRHLIQITNSAPQLLITYDYDQAQMPGPPFSIGGHEVADHYFGAYNTGLLSSQEVPGKLKGKVEALEQVWHLQPKPGSKG